MADVFVSYARPDEPQAKRVAEALRDEGFGVWRDDELPAHRAYAEVIQERLSASKAVVVLWSSEAAKSQWVRAEADVARQAGTLVQATLSGTVPPLPFNQIQCADLTGWHGGDDPGWRKLIASVGELAGATSASERTVQSRKRSVCDLPFVNMSGDAEQEYFSDGISEDITTDLSKVSALSVIARNTAFTFKGQAADVCDIARKLGVGHVLEGSVRKAGGRVRISAQLIDGVTGDHVWAERFDRDLTDIFAIQDEISHSIVDALKLKLMPKEKEAIETRGTSSPEAYDLYLMARQYWASGNDGDARRDQIIIRLCRSAIEVDPHYARAWALLALTLAWMRFRDEKVEDAGLEAAERALELDPALPEPYCVRAGHFARQGQFEQANDEIAKALLLDPESWEANREAGIITIRQRRLKEALRLLEKAASLMETDYRSASLMMSCGLGLDDENVARRAAKMTVERAERALEHDPANAAALSYGAGGLAYLGQAERAAEWIRRAALIDPDNIVMKYNLACSAVGIDEFEMALQFLGPFMAKANPYQVQLAENDPDLDKLRAEPRFNELLAAAKKRLGLEAPALIDRPEAAKRTQP
jgi:adenylate cyclase